MDTDDDKSIKITEKDLPQEFVLKLLGQYEAKGLWGIKHTREPVDAMVKYAKTHEISLPLVQFVITKEGIFMSPIQCRLDNKAKENIMIRKMEHKQYSDKRFVIPKTNGVETWNNDGIVKPRLKPSATTQNILKQLREGYLECQNRKTVNDSKDNYSCFVKKKPEVQSPPPTDLQLLEKYSRYDWRKSGIFFFGIDTISYGVQDLIFTRVFSMIILSDRKDRNLFRKHCPFMCHAFVCESRSTARKVTYALAAAFQAYGRSMKFLRGPEKPLKISKEEKPKKITIELWPPTEFAFNDSEA